MVSAFFSTPSLEKAERFLWGLVLLTLPVTSFRYFPFLGKHTYVRPLAFYPLVLLYLALGFRLWKNKARVPLSGNQIPLLLFLLFAFLSSAAGAFLAPLPLRGQSYWGRVLRAFSTLGIGLSFYFAAMWMHKDSDDMRNSLKWLYGGLVLSLLWVGIQAVALHTPLLVKEDVSAWQQLFSMRGLTKLKRVSGFAFEASWLAGQLIALYLPWLTASLVLRFRVSKYQWLEPLLMLASLAALFLSYSRGGLLIACAAFGVTLSVSGKKAISNGFAWFFHPQKDVQQGKVYGFGIRVVIALFAVVIFWGGLSFLAEQKYVNRLWTVKASSISDYFVKTNAGGRITYLWAEAQLFLDHPVLGTGLGSSGLYLYDYFPDWALYNNPEIAKHLTPTSSLYPNAKNLYLRLLAETGMIGFVLFMSFLQAILAQIVDLLRDHKRKIAGIAGLFSFVAITLYYLMQDSFAMAELWINFGIVAGLAQQAAESADAPSDF